MFEMLVNPKKAERRPWELFFVGIVYASLSVLLVAWIFSQDIVLAKYSGILIVTFAVMFSMPFVYYTIRLEESKDTQLQGPMNLIKEHSKALAAFLFLFMGFIIAFSFWYIYLDNPENSRAQVETFCAINRPNSYAGCVSQYGISSNVPDAFVTSGEKIGMIFANNIYVLIFTIIFSLIFGAGGIFVLAWNASVISAAVVIFANSKIMELPLGLARYMIHGIPEIGAYFIGTLAGGILSLSIIKKDFKSDKFWTILQDTLLLIIIAVVILLIAAIVEVFLTPALF